MTNINTINKLSIAFSKLSKLERIVSEKIINNPEVIVSCSITDAAKKYDVSSSSIQRLAKKIGYSGYSEFRFALANDLKEHKENSFEKNNLDYFSQIVEGYKLEFDQIKDIDMYKNAINLCDLIFNSRQTYMIAFGGTAYVAGYCSHMLFTSGVQTIFIGDQSKTEKLESIVSDNDLIIIFSLSGATSDSYKSIIKSVKQKRVTLVLITCSENNIHGSLIDIAIQLPSYPILINDNNKSIPFIDNRIMFHVFVSLLVFIAKRKLKSEKMEDHTI